MWYVRLRTYVDRSIARPADAIVALKESAHGWRGLVSSGKQINKFLLFCYLAEIHSTEAPGLLNPHGVSVKMAELADALPVTYTQRGTVVGPDP